MDSDAKSAIREAVIGLMDEGVDLDRMAVTGVVQRAHVSRTTFYRHYATVNDVVDEIEDELLGYMRQVNRWASIEHVDETSLKLSQSAMARLSTIADHRDELRAIMGPHGDKSFREKAMAVMRDYWSRRMPGTKTSNGLDLDLYISFMTAGNYEVMLRWITNRQDISIEEMASFVNYLFYAPFAVKNAKGTSR